MTRQLGKRPLERSARAGHGACWLFGMDRSARTSLALTGFAAVTLLSGALGAAATRSSQRTWYRALRRPKFTPPDSVFAPVWTTLYVLSAVSATLVYRARPSANRSRALGLWGVQQSFNALWSPIFFGQRKATLALADLALLWASLAAYATVARRVDGRATALVLPYLGWVSFAGVLNGAIVKQNPRWLHG